MENTANAPPMTPVQTDEKTQFTPWNTIADAKHVYIAYKPELMELRERGFGDLRAAQAPLHRVRVILPDRETKDTGF